MNANSSDRSSQPIEAAQPASSSARADPMGSEAFKRYLKECDDGAISPDAAGAFHWAWMNRLSSALAVGAVAWVSPEQFHAHPDGGDDGSGRYLPVRKSMVGKFTMPLFSDPSTGQDAAQAVARDALEEIALSGMSGSGQESEDGMREWHARRAWEFIGIAARALDAMKVAAQGDGGGKT